MPILGRLRLPHTSVNRDLYFKLSGKCPPEFNECDRAISLAQGDELSFNTYFNSLYEAYYAKYTTLSRIHYQLNLQGSFTLTLYREQADASDRQLLHCQTVTDCQLSSPVKVDIPEFNSASAGRVYLELTCLSDRGCFQESWIATEDPPNRVVNLGIISCTYKKETYITNTVNTILNDPLLRDKSLALAVVDNGRTLDQTHFQDTRVRLIPNRNVGGSGGFTRGLVEALQQDDYTHFLFMDDDVELDSEVIYKLFSLYEYASSEMAIAGGMLDLHKKYLLFEAGAHYAKSLFREGFEPFEISPLKTDLDLRNSAALNSLLIEDPVDYGAFWFFAFPRSFVEKMGLPLPFFIKGDDIEFGLRISRQLQEKIIAFPAIAVWHEPFYAKFPVWDSYYYFRNMLVTHAIHGSLSYFKVVKDMTVRLIYTLLFFDYNSAAMLVKAFEDYLKGPELIKTHDPETYHANIVKLSKSHQNQSVDYTFQPDQMPNIPKASLMQKLVSLLTLNGHFLPDFLLRHEPILIWYGPGFPGQRSRALARKQVLIFKQKAACLYKYDMDKPSGFKILRDWFRIIWNHRSRWSEIAQTWKQAAPEFVSLTFWKNYLQLS